MLTERLQRSETENGNCNNVIRLAILRVIANHIAPSQLSFYFSDARTSQIAVTLKTSETSANPLVIVQG